MLLNIDQNPRQKDEIFSTQADYYFQQKKYNLSATFYARSNSVGFEQVVLKYMDRGEKEAMKVFLLRKLEEMKKTVFFCRSLTFEIYFFTGRYTKYVDLHMAG